MLKYPLKSHIPWNKGKTLSEETRNKISVAQIGKKRTIESVQKRIDARHKSGKPWHSKETIEKMKRNHKGSTGKHWEKTPEQLENSRKANIGEKNPSWCGGISYLPYSVDWTQTLKRSIRERDNYICQECHQYGNNVHHIDYNRKNCNPDNLITLCSKCHMKTNHNRAYWITHFNN